MKWNAPSVRFETELILPKLNIQNGSQRNPGAESPVVQQDKHLLIVTTHCVLCSFHTIKKNILVNHSPVAVALKELSRKQVKEWTKGLGKEEG